MRKLKISAVCLQCITIASIFATQNLMSTLFFSTVIGYPVVRTLVYGVPVFLPVVFCTLVTCLLEKKLNTQIQPSPNNGAGAEEEDGEGEHNHHNMFVYDDQNNNNIHEDQNNEAVINELVAANAEVISTENDNERRAFRRSNMTSIAMFVIFLLIRLIIFVPELRSTMLLLHISLYRLFMPIFTLYNFRLVARLTAEYFADIKQMLVERKQMWAERLRTVCQGNNENNDDSNEENVAGTA